MPGPPIRKPSDHSPPAGSPRNIAGHHVLHRPLMPRHPPNAQKNKQQKTHEHNQEQNTHQQARALSNQFAEIITVRCSRPLYSSQPTHPHPHPTTHKQGSRTRVRQPGRTAPEPRQHATPTPRGGTHHHPTGQQRACLLHQTHQATNQPHTTVHDSTVTQPSARASTPAGPDPSTIQTNRQPGSHPHTNTYP